MWHTEAQTFCSAKCIHQTYRFMWELHIYSLQGNTENHLFPLARLSVDSAEPERPRCLHSPQIARGYTFELLLNYTSSLCLSLCTAPQRQSWSQTLVSTIKWLRVSEQAPSQFHSSHIYDSCRTMDDICCIFLRGRSVGLFTNTLFYAAYRAALMCLHQAAYTFRISLNEPPLVRLSTVLQTETTAHRRRKKKKKHISTIKPRKITTNIIHLLKGIVGWSIQKGPTDRSEIWR